MNIGMAVSVALLSLAALLPSARAESIVIEAESFADPGGWTLDAQHLREMGSPYLLAHGLGKPVADATTTFDATAGDYDLWVRTRNWTAPWSSVPAGRFTLAVNGRTVEATFGVGSGEWRWDKAPAKVTLREGANTLALRDLTGFDGRCDAICFTQGERPDEVRQQSNNLNNPTNRTITADLVVVGGGMAGVCAALSAARSGLSVALVQDRPVLGGNNSSEVRVWLGGHVQVGRYPHLGDVVAEIGPAGGGNARHAAAFEDDRKLRAVKAEKNNTLCLRTSVVAVEKAGEAIAAVIGTDVRTGARTRFAAPLFVDATGDGTVGVLAGADWRMGRESRAESGEPSAPEKADALTMGASCQWRATEAGVETAFPSEPWMVPFDDGTATAALRGDWDWEAGLGRDQVREAERIRDYGMLVAYSNWSFVKNRSARRAEFATKRLDWVASVAGKRESRRLLGDVILSEKDLVDSVKHPDGTCLTSWSIDLHYPLTAAESGFEGESFRSRCEQRKIVMYPIPYRCLYSRNVPNLFMAGRDISVTHIALGSVRVMRTTGMMGEVVGMAAAVCKAHGCRPRDVYARHFGELAARMEKGVGAGLAQARQNYNIHPTYGFDPDDKAARHRHGMLGWAETGDAMAAPKDPAKWSYPPRAWPRWELLRARAYVYDAGLHVGYPSRLADALQAATFRGPDGRAFEVSASLTDGVPCMKGEGYEVYEPKTDRWVACDVFEGTEKVPPHRIGFIPREVTPVFEKGLYSAGGETVAYVHCRAKDCPVLRVGESPEEALGEDPRGFEQSCRMEPAGEPDVWRSAYPLAFRYYRFEGAVEDTWLVTDEMRPHLKCRYASNDGRRNRIWKASAETVRLCTRRFFVDAVKRDRMPWPGDYLMGMLADASTYRNDAAARFSLDALGCAVEDGLADYSPDWVIDMGLYRRLYGDLDYVRRRWTVLRERTDRLAAEMGADGVMTPDPKRFLFVDWGERGQPTTAYNVLMFAAFDSSAVLADELGEKEDAVRWRALAEKVRVAVRRFAYDEKTGLFRTDIRKPDGTVYRQANILAVLFGLVRGEEAKRIADRLAADDLPAVGTTCFSGLECIALLLHGHRDLVERRINAIWGAMVDRGFNVAFEHWWPNAKESESYRFYGRPFGLALCHFFATAPAYLLPRLDSKESVVNPYDPHAKGELK